MMTKRLYFNTEDLSMTTTVHLCTPTQDGEFEIMLDATLFHPQGGGQASDTGTIAGIKVTRVLQTGDTIVHLTSQPVNVGPAFIEVFAEARKLNTQLHSAGHLIGSYGELAGLRAIKGHHWPGEARVVFESENAASAMLAEEIEQQINTWIATNMPRHTSLEAGQRKIAFGHLPAHACGGTHVVSTGQIGKIKVTKLKEKKGQVSVHYELDQP
ncbi:MAG: alanyl-tRNA editing protein [Undibacterium umbellatum]|uniref:alanyl-tRNA editing protein n=1 Tax=Undibacterium umbellatum TaxID=2762300 RepID=UPI003BB7F758